MTRFHFFCLPQQVACNSSRAQLNTSCGQTHDVLLRRGNARVEHFKPMVSACLTLSGSLFTQFFCCEIRRGFSPANRMWQVGLLMILPHQPSVKKNRKAAKTGHAVSIAAHADLEVWNVGYQSPSGRCWRYQRTQGGSAFMFQTGVQPHNQTLLMMQ